MVRPLALAAFLASSSAAAPAPRAPEFKIAKVFNGPVAEVKSLASLKGKVVFLEFWATWCAPCVAGIPRTNRLLDALKGEPFVFLAVTDEPAGMIGEYLKTHEMKAWVGVDEAKSSLKAYKVRGRPDGYLIGKDGTLLARVFPDHLQESAVRDAIAGRYKPAAVAFGGPDEGPASSRSGGRTFFELAISSAGSEPAMSRGDDMLEGDGLPFALLLSWIWDVEQDQIIAEKPPVVSFGFRLKTPPGGLEKGREALKRAVESTFGFTVEPELKETDVYLLALSAAAGAPRPPSDPKLKSGIMASGGGRLLGKATMARFAKALWGAANRPVVDDTGLAGEYFLDLEWKRGDEADRDRALAAAGLRLAPGRRKVEFLRVVSAKNN